MKKQRAAAWIMAAALGMSVCGLSAVAEEVDPAVYTDAEYWLGLADDEVVPWVNINEPSHKVGIVVPNLSTEFYNNLVSTETALFEEKGYTMNAVTIDEDASKACAAIESWTMEGYDAIVFHGHTPACDAALKEAMEKGILVVSQSTFGDYYHYKLNLDNLESGYMNAEVAAQWANEHYDGKCEYIIITNHNNDGNSERSDGIAQRIAELLPDATCVGTVDRISDDQVRNDVETMMTQHPDVKFVCAMYCDFSLISLEVAKGLGIAKKGEFAVFGISMNEQVLNYLKAGDTCYEGEVWLGDQGKMQFLTVYGLLEENRQQPHVYSTPPFIVTSENVETYYEDYYAALD